MKITTPVIVPFLGLAILAACLGNESTAADETSSGGFDTRPEGPSVAALQASGEGVTVVPAAGKDRFTIRFLPQRDSPAAVFSFADLAMVDRLGVAVDVTNTGSRPVRVFAELNQVIWMRGYVSVAPGRTEKLYVFAFLKTSATWPEIGANDAPGFPKMFGIPGGKMWLWAGLDASRAASSLRVFVVMPTDEIVIEVGNIRAFGSSKVPEAAIHSPFIDRYGQYKFKDWPGKVHADVDFAANLRREDQDLATHPMPSGLGQYGGWATGPQLKQTGHFRVEKYKEKWWLVDPEGRLFWSNGIDCVGFVQSATPVVGRERFFDDPAPAGNFLTRNLQTKYGPGWRDVAGDRLLRRLHSWGLNTLGAWSDPALEQKHRVPYTLDVPTGGLGGPPIDPASAAWTEHMRRALTDAAAAIKDDPWCIGFFVDNEIHVSTGPAWFERYYRQVSAVAREVMPNTLYLGSRLDYHEWPNESDARKEIVRLAAKYCDVISFNLYKFTLEDFTLPDGVDRPAIIGEFHMGALDRGGFHTGLRSVIDQSHRAEAYSYYVTTALRNPSIVGAHWFQCYDESLTGRFDGENCQIGFLDICDTPYAEIIAAARDVGDRLYTIRTGP